MTDEENMQQEGSKILGTITEEEKRYLDFKQTQLRGVTQEINNIAKHCKNIAHMLIMDEALERVLKAHGVDSNAAAIRADDGVIEELPAGGISGLSDLIGALFNANKGDSNDEPGIDFPDDEYDGSDPPTH